MDKYYMYGEGDNITVTAELIYYLEEARDKIMICDELEEKIRKDSMLMNNPIILDFISRLENLERRDE